MAGGCKHEHLLAQVGTICHAACRSNSLCVHHMGNENAANFITPSHVDIDVLQIILTFEIIVN